MNGIKNPRKAVKFPKQMSINETSLSKEKSTISLRVSLADRGRQPHSELITREEGDGEFTNSISPGMQKKDLFFSYIFHYFITHK